MRCRPVTRTPHLLTAKRFDLLIVGGGIHGLAAARGAAMRGLSVALVERGDFVGGASFNHLKTLHGGLRALQTLDLIRFREGIRERAAMARLAPHLVRPLPFLLATRRTLTRSRTALRTAFIIDRLLSADRNRSLPEWLHLPPGRVISRAEALERAPGLPASITGAALWFDYQLLKTERHAIGFAHAAAEHGATLANYVEAVEGIVRHGRLMGLRVRDAMTGDHFDVEADVVLNAAGPAVGVVANRLGLRVDWPVQRAMNLVTTRPAPSCAVAAALGSGTLFLVPWRDRMVVGTWHEERAFDPASMDVPLDAVERMCVDVNASFPGLDLRVDEITLVHRGLVPGLRAEGERVIMRPRSAILDHARDGLEGALSIIGVKYTTGRSVAEAAVDLVLRKKGRPNAPSASADTPLPGAAVGPVSDASRALQEAFPSVTRASADHLADTYGTAARDVLDVRGRTDLLAPIASGAPCLRAEVVYAIRHEMAMTLADVVLRRIGLGDAGHPGETAARDVARVMQQELGWSDTRVTDELAALRHAYLPVTRDSSPTFTARERRGTGSSTPR